MCDMMFLFGDFEEKCPTLTVGSFLDALGPLFCSFAQQQLELRTSKTYSKRQKLVQNKNIDVQNLENIIMIPLWCFSLWFFWNTENVLFS